MGWLLCGSALKRRVAVPGTDLPPLPGFSPLGGFHHAHPAPRQLPGVLPDARGLDRGELPLGVRSVYTWRPERVPGVPEMRIQVLGGLLLVVGLLALARQAIQDFAH